MSKLNPSKKSGLFHHHLSVAECRTEGFYSPTVILINLTDGFCSPIKTLHWMQHIREFILSENCYLVC